MSIDPNDDRPHGESGNPIIEHWQFDFWSPEHDLGAWTHLAFDHSAGFAWYVSALMGAKRPLIIVVDPAIKIPKLSPYLEFRAEGIWAQHVCETPLKHWTVGLEAFGVTLDTPADAMGDQWGERTGVGLDVEWEEREAAYETSEGFAQHCIVTGEVLIDDEVCLLDTTGHRNRCWKTAKPPTELSNAISIRVGTKELQLQPAFDSRPWQAQILE